MLKNVLPISDLFRPLQPPVADDGEAVSAADVEPLMHYNKARLAQRVGRGALKLACGTAIVCAALQGVRFAETSVPSTQQAVEAAGPWVALGSTLLAVAAHTVMKHHQTQAVAPQAAGF